MIKAEEDGVFVPALVVERAPHGSLHDVLQHEFPSLTMQDRINLCIDATTGLMALHQAQIIHGDVKAENILIFNSPDPLGPKKYVAKLSDFGSIIKKKIWPSCPILWHKPHECTRDSGADG